MLPVYVDNENAFYQSYVDTGLVGLARVFERHSLA